MPSARIREESVLGFSPNLSAAPRWPETFQLAASNARTTATLQGEAEQAATDSGLSGFATVTTDNATTVSSGRPTIRARAMFP